ncbi:uncharacterized protein LOC114541434 [Dendronephthya gigantea]|uniref:uncharacterized protein LOC114541434 n=1 Tax=Dendronephthya gigantea TaxID=151771 RepID=UPI001069A123|nr:uncharacterized protein LOC114541434 [Dendronephthya gigantea]
MSTDQPSSSGGSAPTTTHHKVAVMPEAFGAGDKEDWVSWLKYFNNCAKLNKWSPEEKRDFLAVRLRGAAQETYFSLSDEVQDGTFDGLAEALGKKFAPVERLELYKAEFQARRRTPGEKLSELASNLSKMARKAFPGAPAEILDRLTMDRFIASLDSTDLRIRVREGNPKTFDECLSRAIQLEAIYEAEIGQNRGKSSRVQTVEKSAEMRISEMLTKQTAALEKAVNLLSERAKSGDGNSRNKPGFKSKGKITCWKCGGVGHVKAKCPTQDLPSGKPEN